MCESVENGHKAQGAGTRYAADGSQLESGEYKSGVLQGAGTTLLRGTRHRYHGKLLNGRPHGAGSIDYVASAASSSSYAAAAAPLHRPPLQQQHEHSFGRYEGNWHSGSRFGAGRMQMASDAALYEGNWRDDRHGLGALTFSDGGLHCGQWSCGRAEGHGISWDASGTRTHCGWFVNGALAFSAPVPREVVTDTRFLSPPEQEASLLYPDGAYFHGTLPNLLAPRFIGTLYNADGTVRSSGAHCLDLRLHALS